VREHPSEAELQDHGDGTPDPSRLDAVTSHLTECPSCRSHVDRVRVLMDDLRELPRDIQPARDLRPTRPATTPRPPLRERRRRNPDRRRWLAAAAVLVPLLAYSLVRLSSGTDRPGGAPAAGNPEALLEGEWIGRQIRSYEAASRDLQLAYRRRRQTLPASTADLVDAHLATVDRAIARTAASRDASHGDALVGQMLLARYEAKVELLRQAIDIGGER